MPRYLSIYLTPPDRDIASPGQIAASFLSRNAPKQESRAAHSAKTHSDSWPQQELTRLALWHQRYTPLAASDAPDGIMLDVAGAAHLFGGEAALMAHIENNCRRQLHLEACTGLADTPEAAWALARFGENKTRILARGAPEKTITRVMAGLPMAALRLEAATLTALAQTGLKRIGDIIARPRAPLAARFGKLLFTRLDAMLGRTKSPISPQFEAPGYIAERRFADGVTAREAIEATIRALARDLTKMLERHDEGARQLMAALFRIDGKVMHITCSTSRPLRSEHAIARLFHEKIDAAARANEDDPLDAGFGFDVIRLAVMQAEPLHPQQTGLHAKLQNASVTGDMASLDEMPREEFPHEERPHEELALFLDRMSARFGASRVLRFTSSDTHIPEHAVIAAPAVQSPTAQFSRPRANRRKNSPALPGLQAQAAPALFSIARPIRLFEKAEPVETLAMVPDGPPLRFKWRRVLHEVVAFEGPECIAPQWWKQEIQALTRDYFRVEDRGGRRFWLYREGLYERETQRPRWFLHGLFG